MTDAATYEKSYKRMWDDIARARKERDDALKIVDVARNLVVALEHDFNAKTTVASAYTHHAFDILRSRLADQ